MSEELTEGWGGPALAKKYHYFRDGRALCGRWLYTGVLDPHNPKETTPRRDDCTVCFKKIATQLNTKV